MVASVLSLMGTVAPVAAAARPARAGAAVVPAAEVQVSPRAREGQGGTIRASLLARCATPYTFQELSVEFSQGGFTAPSMQLRAVACDGQWHGVAVTSQEGFDPGHASLSARMTVIDDVTGDPARQAVDTQAIWVRPAARVVISNAHLLSNGAVVIRLRARCDRPWVESSLTLSLTQGVGENGVGASPRFPSGGVVCDEVWHAVDLRTRKHSGFRRAPARMDATLTVFDPLSFDPVSQASAGRSVLIR